MNLRIFVYESQYPQTVFLSQNFQWGTASVTPSSVGALYDQCHPFSSVINLVESTMSTILLLQPPAF